MSESTELSEIEAQELANIQAEMAAQAAELQESLVVESSNISNAGKQFTMPDGTNMGNSMEVVILGHIRAHELYPDTVYNANKPEAPICYSRNYLKDASVPHKNVEKPECDNCEDCPNNEWGSKGQGKACSETYRVAVIVPKHNQTVPMTLKIAPTGMKGFDSSISGIQKAFGQNGNLAMPYAAIVTAEFTDAPYPVVKITGTNARAVSPQELLAYHRLAKDAVDALL